MSLNPNQYLLNSRKDLASQFGEDGIIEKIFEIIKETDGWCVEFGAWDGKFCSNSWNLINNKGYSAVLIEANKEKFAELQELYRPNNKITCINKFVNFEGSDSLDNILSATPIPKNFDFVSIDIDGNDYHMWDSLRIYKPKVVLIEFNAFIPDEVVFIQEKNMEVQHGNSLKALVELGKSKGYELVSINQENAFFVSAQYFSLFNIQDNSIRALKHFRHPLNIFQLYDGTIVVDGSQYLYYYGIPVDFNKKFQVLPKLLRKKKFPWNQDNRIAKTLMSLCMPFVRNKKAKMWDKQECWGWKEKYDSLL